MKKTILTFGLISGVMISVLMGRLTLPPRRQDPGYGHSMLLGYTMMVRRRSLLVYFGIRSYPRQQPGRPNLPLAAALPAAF